MTFLGTSVMLINVFDMYVAEVDPVFKVFPVNSDFSSHEAIDGTID